MNEVTAKSNDSRVVRWDRLRRIWGFVRPSRGRLWVVFFLILLTTMSGLAMPVLLEKTIDEALQPPFDRRVLIIISVAAAAIGILRFATGLLQQYHLTHVTTRVLFRMRQAFYRHLQGLPIRFFTQTRIGEILTRMGRDVAEIQGVATGALLAFASATLTITGTIALLVWYSWELLLLSLVVVPFLVVVARAFRRRVMDRTREVREANEEIASFLVETVTGMKTVRAHGRQRREARRFVQLQRRLISRVMRMVMTAALGGGLPNMVILLGSSVVFVYGGFAVVNGEMQLGDLVAFSVLQARIYGPVQGMVRLYLQVQQAMVSVERIFEYLDTPASEFDVPGAVRMDGVEGVVEFVDVAFSHDQEQETLKAISFRLEQGEHCALVGRSGAGKSTLIELLLRIRRPDFGKILVDGHDLSNVVLSSVNRHMAVVSQDVFLFHQTLRENVRYGRADATDEEVDRAMSLCALSDMVDRLPKGADSILGERGEALSGGERQRIALARAMLREPRILVLDEPMAHLDRESDRQVTRNLVQFMEGRTCLVSSHHVPAGMGLKRVLVLEEGMIVADGDPDLLMGRNELFRRLQGAGEDQDAGNG